MDNNIVIVTDSGSDLPLEYIESNNITAPGLTCLLGGKEYTDDFGKTLSHLNTNIVVT